MNRNPYTILGVSPDATDEEITKAHRRMVKLCHPDAGGSPEAFAEVSAAVELLRDPKRRKLFDETGSFQTNSAAALDAQAMQLVAMIVEAVLNKPMLDLDRMDFCALLKGELGGMLEKARQTERQMKTQLERTDKAIKRLKRTIPKPPRKKKGEERPAPSPNMLDMVLVGRRANIDRALDRAAAEIGVMTRVKDHLDEFGYDMDAMQTMRINMGGMFSGPNSPSGW